MPTQLSWLRLKFTEKFTVKTLTNTEQLKYGKWKLTLLIITMEELISIFNEIEHMQESDLIILSSYCKYISPYRTPKLPNTFQNFH